MVPRRAQAHEPADDARLGADPVEIAPIDRRGTDTNEDLVIDGSGRSSSTTWTTSGGPYRSRIAARIVVITRILAHPRARHPFVGPARIVS
jgi:hypothetical protein